MRHISECGIFLNARHYNAKVEKSAWCVVDENIRWNVLVAMSVSTFVLWTDIDFQKLLHHVHEEGESVSETKCVCS